MLSTVWTSTGAWSYLKCKKDMVFLGGGHDIKFWEIICYLTIPVWGSIGVLMPGLARARSSSDSGLNTNTNASACRYKMAHIFIIITGWYLQLHIHKPKALGNRVAFFTGFSFSATNWLKTSYFELWAVYFWGKMGKVRGYISLKLPTPLLIAKPPTNFH